MCTRACLRIRVGCPTYEMSEDADCSTLAWGPFFSLSFCTDCQTKIRNNIEKNRMLWLVSWRPNMRKHKHCDCAYVFLRSHTVYQSPLRRYLKQMTTFHILCLRVCFGPSARWCVPIGEKSRRFTGKPALSRQGFLPKTKQKWMVSKEQIKVSVEMMWRRVQFYLKHTKEII